MPIFIYYVTMLPISPNASFYLCGFYSILLATTIPAYLILKWKADTRQTLSQHVAKGRTTYIIFAVGSIIWQSLFVAFMMFWFVPAFHLGRTFLIIMIIGSLCQVISALIPDTHGWSSRVHRIAAYTMGAVMYANTVWLLASPSIVGFARSFCYISLFMMTGLLLSLVLQKRTRERILIIQVLFILSFYTTVLIVGYIH